MDGFPRRNGNRLAKALACALLGLVHACSSSGTPPVNPGPAPSPAGPDAGLQPEADIFFEAGSDATVAPPPPVDAAAHRQDEAGQCEAPVRPQRLLDRLAADSRFRGCSKDTDCALYGPQPGCECVPYFSSSTQSMNWRGWQKDHAKCACERPSSLTYVPVCRAGICRVLDRGFEERCLENGTYWTSGS